MAGLQDGLSAQKRSRALKQRDQVTRSQGIKKEQQPQRRSERISQLQRSLKDQKPEQSFLAEENQPFLLPPKRLREAEDLANHVPTEQPQKRLEPSPVSHSRRQTFDQGIASGLSAPRHSHISHWVQNGQVWPDELLKADKIEEDDMHRVLAKKKSKGFLRRKRSEPSLITQSSATPSDQRPREVKSAPYQHVRYEIQLSEHGIFMDRYEDDITDESKILCQKLLETPQKLLEDSLFADYLFKETFEIIRNRNEARVIRDIGQLIVPPAEISAIRGSKHLRILTETVNEGWNNCVPILGPRPQPDYGLGFVRRAFNQERLQKLQPLVGEWDDLSLFAATYNMYLPFLTAEVKCGAAGLDVADRQNAHSIGVALRGLVELFRLVGREKELHCEINGFSVSHNNDTVRIYGHFAVINGTKTTIHRRLIHSFSFTALDGKEKWTAFTFIKNVYDIWVPPHFERICSVIDELPAELDFEVSQEQELHVSETSGLSQQFENQASAQPSSSQSGLVDLQQVTPDTSTRPEKPNKKKKSDTGTENQP